MPEVRIPLAVNLNVRMTTDSKSGTSFSVNDVIYEWTSGIFNGVVTQNPSTGKLEVSRRNGFESYRYKDFDQDPHASGYLYEPENNVHWWVANDSSSNSDYVCADDGNNIGDISHRISTTPVQRYSTAYSKNYTSTFFIGTEIDNATSSVTAKIFYEPANGGGIISNMTPGGQGIPNENYCVGLHFFHDYMFLMTESGKIHNCNLSTPFTWTSTDFISISDDAGYPVYLAKHNDNLVACSSNTLEYFYDAGNPAGSPLNARKDLTLPLGVLCEIKNSRAVSQAIDSDDEHIVFVAQRKGRNNQSGEISSNHDGVYLIENFRATKISTPAIDAVISETLAGNVSPGSYTTASIRLRLFTFLGRKMIALQGSTARQDRVVGYGTPVYDMTTGMWYSWKWASDNSMNIMDSCGDYLMCTYGQIIRGSSGLTADVTTPTPVYQIFNFPFGIMVDSYDGETSDYKYCYRTRIAGNYAQSQHDVTISWSDQDSVTEADMTSSRTYDLRYHRPLTRCGRFRNRRFFIEKDSTNTGAGLPITMSELVLTLDRGAVGGGDQGGN